MDLNKEQVLAELAFLPTPQHSRSSALHSA